MKQGHTPKKVDENQHLIVEALRTVGGVSIQFTHGVGRGFVDLVLGVRGLTLVGDFNAAEVLKRLEGVEGLTVHRGASLLVEVKNPGTKQPWRFTPAEKAWHKFWRGQKAVVETPGEALALVGKRVSPNP